MPGPTGTVLVVDDEADICTSMADVIQALLPGVKVHTASNGPAALERMETTHIDLLITDFQMPGMNGLELLEAVRKRFPEMRALLFTGFPDANLRRRASEQPNLLHFYVKPVDPVPLTQTIADALTS